MLTFREVRDFLLQRYSGKGGLNAAEATEYASDIFQYDLKEYRIYTLDRLTEYFNMLESEPALPFGDFEIFKEIGYRGGK